MCRHHTRINTNPKKTTHAKPQPVEINCDDIKVVGCKINIQK